MPNSIVKKEEQLNNNLKEYAKEDVIVAFSGGVDSSLILKKACEFSKEHGTKVFAVNIKTSLHPRRESEEARAMAENFGAKFIVLTVNELKEAGIENNPVDRCYLCKKTFFKKIKEIAKEKNINKIIEGTNEDDLHVYRPGIKALKELNIISPLAENNISKNEVRMMAEKLNIKVADKPSTPCIATRFPYGTMLNKKDILKVEKSEDFIKKLGFYNVRVRAYGNTARIEVDKKDLEKLLKNRENVWIKLKELGFDYVTMDLEGFRSGSMDEKIKK